MDIHTYFLPPTHLDSGPPYTHCLPPTPPDNHLLSCSSYIYTLLTSCTSIYHQLSSSTSSFPFSTSRSPLLYLRLLHLASRLHIHIPTASPYSPPDTNFLPPAPADTSCLPSAPTDTHCFPSEPLHLVSTGEGGKQASREVNEADLEGFWICRRLIFAFNTFRW